MFLNYLDKFFNYMIVKILNIKFDSLPVDNIYFLFASGLPICFNLIFLHTVLTVYWRLQSMVEYVKITLDTSLNLREILKSQGKIFDTISLLNRYHTPNYVFTMLDMLMVAITASFLIYDILIHSLTFDNFFLMSAGFTHFALSALLCLVIIFYGSKIKELQKEIIVTIAKSQIKQIQKSDFKPWKKCQLAICQLEISKNEFSCGLFELNCKQIFVMMSSFFSFLIVMIQFDLMINDN